MNHEAIRIDYADGRALICLVGKDHASGAWEHVRTLANVDAEVGDLDGVTRRWASRLQLRVL